VCLRCIFFFSSRRRHTRSKRDWSSDVCSSDLDMKPFGQYVMTDLDRIGGVPVVMQALLDEGLLHGDALTVTGKTVAENLADLKPKKLDGDVLRTMDNPIHATGGLTVLHGSMAP